MTVMQAKYSAMEIAAYIVKKGTKMGLNDMTPLKLQKLVYISHGWYLGLAKSPLIREYVQAWEYGPVIPEVYDQTRDYYKKHIPSLASFDSDIADENDKALLDRVMDVYGEKPAFYLVNITHQKDTPWDKVTNGGRNFGRGVYIPNETIQEYYEGLISARQK